MMIALEDCHAIPLNVWRNMACAKALGSERSLALLNKGHTMLERECALTKIERNGLR